MARAAVGLVLRLDEEALDAGGLAGEVVAAEGAGAEGGVDGVADAFVEAAEEAAGAGGPEGPAEFVVRAAVAVGADLFVDRAAEQLAVAAGDLEGLGVPGVHRPI